MTVNVIPSPGTSCASTASPPAVLSVAEVGKGDRAVISEGEPRAVRDLPGMVVRVDEGAGVETDGIVGRGATRDRTVGGQGPTSRGFFITSSTQAGRYNLAVSDKLTPQEQNELKDLLVKWNRRCRRALIAYNRATEQAVALEKWLGVPAILSAAIVATGVFATLAQNPGAGWRIATGMLSVASAVLAGLQTFLKLGERAELYQNAARRYGEQRRHIELALISLPEDREQAMQVVTQLRDSLSEAAKGNPNAPRRIWREADREVSAETVRVKPMEPDATPLRPSSPRSDPAAM